MKLFSIFGALAVLSAWVFPAISAVGGDLSYAPNFDSYKGRLTLSGQDSWATTDGNRMEYVGIVNGYSRVVSDFLVLMGGLFGGAPSGRSVELSRQFELADGNNVAFSVDMGLSLSATPRPNRDAFGWTFRNVDGLLISAVNFKPSTTSGTQTWTISYSDYMGVETATVWKFSANSMIRLNVSLLGLETEAPRLSIGFTPYSNWVAGTTGKAVTVVKSAVLPVGTPSGVTSVGAQWNVLGASTGDYGLNALIFDNYAVSVVPEPTTGALLCVVGVGVFVARRRLRDGCRQA